MSDTYTMAVDPANPCDVFACCGLLELAARDNPEAAGRFEGGRFVLAGSPVPPTDLLLSIGEPVPELPTAKSEALRAGAALARVSVAARRFLAAVRQFEDEPGRKRKGQAVSAKDIWALVESYAGRRLPKQYETAVSAAADAAVLFPAVGIRLGWWRDDDPGTERGDDLPKDEWEDMTEAEKWQHLVRLPDVSFLRPWGGRDEPAQRLGLMLDCVRRDRPDDLLGYRATTETPPLGIDPDLVTTALDVGFSLHQVGVPVMGRPAAEVLAVIGLETCRPLEIDSHWHYRPWGDTRTVVAARQAIGTYRPAPGPLLAFRQVRRAKGRWGWQRATKHYGVVRPPATAI